MFPVLWTFPEGIPLLGGISIYTYGALAATGFLCGILWIMHEARLAGVNREKVADLSFYLIVAAIVGSRLLYMIVEYERFLAHPLDALKLWEGGLVFYGGLLACIAVSWWYTRQQSWTLRGISDLFMPGVALGHGIGRMGCLMAGCCYGKPVAGDPWWAISFPHNASSLAPAGIPLIPIQLLESLVEFGIFLILVFVRRHKKFEGQVFLTYLIIYAFLRSVLELFRGDTIRGFIIPDILSTSQLISLLVIVASIVYYRRLKLKEGKL
jgi:phosphatidylglycerol:prolipoprotein diacylglycerol transferase